MHSTQTAQKALLFAVVMAAAACRTEPDPEYVTEAEPPPVPGNERAFAQYMLEHLEGTIDEVTCHCCAKPLSQCYREMLDQAHGACPPG